MGQQSVRGRSNAAATRTGRTLKAKKNSPHDKTPRGKKQASREDCTGPIVTDLVHLYLREISQTPLLTHRQEIELAKTIRRGQSAARRLGNNGHAGPVKTRLEEEIRQGAAARCILMRSNLRLVVNMAKHYIGRGLTFLDLIQEGNIGLMRAVDKFDHRRGHKFSTHATWWIRQGITRAIGNLGNSPRLPAHTGQWLRFLERTSRGLTQELGRDPTDAEIAQRMKIPVHKVQRLISAHAGTLSLEMPLGDDPETTLGDFLEDSQTPSPLNAAVESAMRKDLSLALETLSPREARVLTLRFGLRDGCDQTLEKVGERFGLTRERIRQIEREALEKLRSTSSFERLMAYLGTNVRLSDADEPTPPI